MPRGYSHVGRIGALAIEALKVTQGGLNDPPWRWRRSSVTRFNSQSVIHCNPELLLASKVALRRLDGDVAE